MSQKQMNIAIVGCGAIVEQQHLPSLTSRDDCRVTTLVERDVARAEALAQRFDVPHVVSDYQDLFDMGIDGVIVALPNHLHAPISIDLLKAGLHVLVEKPMGLSVAECDAMLAVAEKEQAILAVGLMRRFSQAGRYAKWAIDSGLLGKITSFDFQNGFVYNWAVTTDFFLRKNLAGGGVLMDLGVHTLDQLLWWLGDVESLTYYDDDFGGVEADCELHLTLKSGAEGIASFSRTRDLRETAIIRGEKAELEVGLISNTLSLRFNDSDMGIQGFATKLGEPPRQEQRVADLMAAQHAEFIAAMQTGSPVSVPGTEARRSIALIEACYDQRQPYELPWLTISPSIKEAV